MTLNNNYKSALSMSDSKSSEPTRGTKFCFTDFGLLNWEKIFSENKDFFRFIAWGNETCPKTGKTHYQGFMQLYTTRRFASIKKICKYAGLHLEVMRGSFNQNEKYCSKEGQYSKLGEFVKQGQRTDLEQVEDDIINSNGDKTVIMENHAEAYMKFHAGIDKLCAHYQQKNNLKWMDVETTVLVGSAGVGKSSYVYKKHGYENVFTVDSDADSKFLCDGYAGEKVLLIDDFNGYVKYSTLLRLLDGHPMKLNVKGSRIYKAWTHVYITSNVSPALWYNRGVGDNLLRRIDSCHEVGKGVILIPFTRKDIQNKITKYDTYGDE